MGNPPLIVGLLINVIEAEGIEFIGPVHEWEPSGEAWGPTSVPQTATSTR
jgi:hypothetical protein